MKIIQFLLISLFFSFSIQSSFAQKPSKRAASYYQNALRSYQLRKLNQTESFLKKAIKADKKFIEPHLFLGDLYNEVGRVDDGKKQYKIAIQKQPEYSRSVYEIIAELELEIGAYDSALLYLDHYFEFPNLEGKNNSKAKLMREKCVFAIEALKNPVPFNPENLGSNINTRYPEYFPCLTVDNNTLLFTRRLKVSQSRQSQRLGTEQEDFYISKRGEDYQWEIAKDIGSPINSELNEGAPTLSADGQILIFTACGTPKYYGPDRKGEGSCDFFRSYYQGEGKWSKPENVGKPVNSYYWESQPSFSADGKTLYFVRAGGRGKGRNSQDIWSAELQENGEFSQPKRLDTNINTPYCEESVFIHPDGKTLYFASSGHPGMGGLDIFMSQKQSDGSWSKAKNLGYPINTFNDENSIMISSNGVDAYFASDRKGGFGDLDLYSFTVPIESRPNKVNYMKGIVFDAKTRKPLWARFELIDLETGEQVVQSFSNYNSGDFLLALPTDRNYALNVSKKGYLFYSENFKMEGLHSQLDPFLKNIPLQPIEIGQITVLRNIFFDLDKFDLKPNSQVELEKLVTFLKQNPTLHVEISGHTDNQGDNEHNTTLSYNRAKAVYNYLVENNIEKSRLQFKGYGENQPVDSNETLEGKAKNRRTEMKIISTKN